MCKGRTSYSESFNLLDPKKLSSEECGSPATDEYGVIHLSVGDIANDGSKQIMFVDKDNNLKICILNNNELKLVRPEGLDLDTGNYKESFFFDIDDIGTSGILYRDKDSNLKGYININEPSNYFLKALAFGNTNNGQSRIGISYQYLMTNNNGEEILRVGHQAISNVYRNLQLPFMLDGLSQSQNYIEYLTFSHYKAVILFFIIGN